VTEPATLCIACGETAVTWPLVCEGCRDDEAQARLEADGAEPCRSCGMLYDGGTRCTYCGDADPLDGGEFADDDEADTCHHGVGFDEDCEQCEMEETEAKGE
jgi:hypothetical protein